MFPRLALILLLTCRLAIAQEAPAADVILENKEVVAAEAKDVNALGDLLSTIASQNSQLDELREELTNSLTEDEKTDITTAIDTLKARRSANELQFEVIATGLREEDIQEQKEEALSLEQELRQLMSPLLNEIRDATENPREIDRLKNEIDTLKKRHDISRGAVINLQRLLTETPDKDNELKEQLSQALTIWEESVNSSSNRLSATELQLEKRQAQKNDFFTTVSLFFKDFFKSRGWNILMAIMAFCAVYFLLKKIFPLVRKLSPVHKKGGKTVASRAVDVLYAGVTITLATVAALIALYLAGDWVLLSLAALILLGLFWGARQAIPPMLEQIRLILNIGPVREDERIIYDGIPWRVAKLALYSKLVNPALAGGMIRLPARSLLDCHSRPFDKDEIWFPTKKLDWVILADDTFGKVLLQSPEYVQILELGGSRKTFPMADFLALTPKNLSQGFRIKIVFGIDYDHQSISTSEVPQIFKERLAKELSHGLSEDKFHGVNVYFASAAASSLDYEILADFTGEAAPVYQKLRRHMQAVCVDVCNEQNWGIPFQQITIHQAEN